MILVIPAYEPSEKLLLLLREMKDKDNCHIILVDDGSGSAFDSIFRTSEKMGCTVLRYEKNKGKGYALRYAFAYISKNLPKDIIVCADCDGQHAPKDILRVADKTMKNDNRLVLGSRKFIPPVPFRSLFGNKMTCYFFRLATGIRINDTQTGLRGIPFDLLPWLCTVKGNRFEYELNVLLEAQSVGYQISEIPIATLYLEGNKSSHFRPIIDSARIYFPLIKFSFSSLIGFLIDFLFLFIFMKITDNLLFSVVGARTISSLSNFLINRIFVFNHKAKLPLWRAAIRYYSLVIFILFCNYGILYFLAKELDLTLFRAKIITETTLFFLSFNIQKIYVFSKETINMTLPKKRREK